LDFRLQSVAIAPKLPPYLAGFLHPYAQLPPLSILRTSALKPPLNRFLASNESRASAEGEPYVEASLFCPGPLSLLSHSSDPHTRHHHLLRSEVVQS
jgi:hypothetical protein